MILHFTPSHYSNGVKNEELKKRFMLVLDVDDKNNTLKLVNISKVQDKPNCLTYKSSVLIKNHQPLPLLSFAKLDDNYIVENFDGIEKFLYDNGTKLDEQEFKNIVNKHDDYLFDNRFNLITMTKDEFLKTNYLSQSSNYTIADYFKQNNLEGSYGSFKI